MMTRRKASVAAQKATRIHVGYARVSTDEQASKGVSLADQEARIRAHAFARGIELAEVIIDGGYSAGDLKRPGVTRMIEMIERGEIASVTITKLDRITRRTRDLDKLLEMTQKHDFALVSVGESLDTSTAAGRMVVGILGVVAQWEREAIQERTAFAMAHKRSKGEFCGGARAPYGYRAENGLVVKDDAEQVVLARIAQAHEDRMSLRKIVAMLNTDAIPGPRGGAWHLSGLVAVMDRIVD